MPLRFLLFFFRYRASSDLLLPIRLVGGDGDYKGSIEVFYNNHCDSVCDDFWDINDAQVVCHQLGFAYAVAAIDHSEFIIPAREVYLRHSFCLLFLHLLHSIFPSSDPIWLDDVVCLGTEPSLANCSASDCGVTNCDHYGCAGVICTSEQRLSGHSYLTFQTYCKGFVFFNNLFLKNNEYSLGYLWELFHNKT